MMVSLLSCSFSTIPISRLLREGGFDQVRRSDEGLIVEDIDLHVKTCNRLYGTAVDEAQESSAGFTFLGSETSVITCDFLLEFHCDRFPPNSAATTGHRPMYGEMIQTRVRAPSDIRIKFPADSPHPELVCTSKDLEPAPYRGRSSPCLQSCAGEEPGPTLPSPSLRGHPATPQKLSLLRASALRQGNQTC